MLVKVFGYTKFEMNRMLISHLFIYLKFSHVVKETPEGVGHLELLKKIRMCEILKTIELLFRIFYLFVGRRFDTRRSAHIAHFSIVSKFGENNNKNNPSSFYEKKYCLEIFEIV